MDEDLAAEFEQERLERLAELDGRRREDNPDWRRTCARGPLGVQETLHMAHVFADMVDRHLAGHPVVLLHPHLYALAATAGMALAELHQVIGDLPTRGEGE